MDSSQRIVERNGRTYVRLELGYADPEQILEFGPRGLRQITVGYPEFLNAIFHSIPLVNLQYICEAILRHDNKDVTFIRSDPSGTKKGGSPVTLELSDDSIVVLRPNNVETLIPIDSFMCPAVEVICARDSGRIYLSRMVYDFQMQFIERWEEYASRSPVGTTTAVP
jgi:hypothetical protein